MIRFKLGDVVRVTSRPRAQAPYSGDLCKVTSMSEDSLSITVVGSTSGDESRIGFSGKVQKSEVEQLGVDDQIALLDSIKTSKKIDADRLKNEMEAIDDKKTWLKKYRSEEGVLVNLIYDMIQDGKSRDEIIAEVQEKISGRITFL